MTDPAARVAEWIEVKRRRWATLQDFRQGRSNVAGIAANLNDAQRAVVRSARQHRSSNFWPVVGGDETLYLAGILETGGIMFSLTPLGLAVRAELLEQAHD